MDVPPQDVITRDNVSVKVNAVVYFRVIDPQRAVIQVEDFLMATSQLAQTTLRAILGKHELDQLLAEREKLNLAIQQVLDVQTDAWGIKVANVEIKHVAGGAEAGAGAGGHAAPLPADPHPGRRRKEFDHRVPGTHRSLQAGARSVDGSAGSGGPGLDSRTVSHHVLQWYSRRSAGFT